MHADSTRSSRKYACPILLQFGLRNHASISVSLWLRFCESACPWLSASVALPPLAPNSATSAWMSSISMALAAWSRRLSAALSDRPHRTPAPSSIGSRVHPNRALRAPSAFASRISRSYRRANCGQRIHSRAPRSLLIVPGIFLFLRAWRLSRPRASS